MRSGSSTLPIEAIRRKLRAMGAVLADPAATEHERNTAGVLKRRLERRLRAAGAPKGDWTDSAFRLGRLAGAARRSTDPAAPKGDWTDAAHRFGRALRRGWTRLSSQ